MFLKKADNHRRNGRRIDVTEMVNEGFDRHAFGGRIKRAIHPARFAMRRAPVQLADLVDGLLLIFESNESVAFAAVMQHCAGLGEME